MAGDLSDANRQACAETTKPLVEAVEALTTFASSPQFASTPAKISAQARQAQEPILQAGKNINKSSNSLLTSAKSLVINPNDPPMWQLLASHTKAVTDAIKTLILAIKEKCPGQKECDNAIDCLNENITHLDQAILAAMSQQLQPHASSTLQVRAVPLMNVLFYNKLSVLLVDYVSNNPLHDFVISLTCELSCGTYSKGPGVIRLINIVGSIFA